MGVLFISKLKIYLEKDKNEGGNMNEIIVIIICILILVFTKIGLNIKFKDLKQLKTRTNEKARKMAEKFPDDEEMCKDILKKLGNNSEVKILKNEEYNSCLYTIYNNTITLGKFKEDYIKPQTIAHECVHSCQSKVMLWFNFIISNIFNLFYIVTLIFAIFNKLPNANLFLIILTGIAFIQYVIRNALEMEAMTRAPYVAKEYLAENKILTEKEIKDLLEEYEDVNKIGMPITNYSLILKSIVKVIIFCIVVLI